MSNGITLTSAMRNNLGALKYLSGQMDITQTRLATGQKVNSAIDNASSFYQARALTNRASDLDRLLDSMGQSIQTINAAISGLEHAGATLEQAAVVAQQAYESSIDVPSVDWFRKEFGDENTVFVTSAEELQNAIDSGKTTICVYGDINIDNSIAINNQKLVGINYFGNFTANNKEYFSTLNYTTNKRSTMILSYGESEISSLNINFDAKNAVFDGSWIGSAIEVRGQSLIKDVNIDMRIPNGKFTSGYAAIKTDTKGGVYKNANALITGNINIDTDVWGIFAENASACEISGNLSITSKAYGIGAHNHSSIVIKSGSAIKTSGYLFLVSSSKMVLEDNVSLRFSEYRYISTHSTSGLMQIGKDCKLINSTTAYDFVEQQEVEPNSNINENNIEQALNVEQIVYDEAKEQFEKAFEPVKSTNYFLGSDIEQYNGMMSAYDDMIKDSSYQGINLLTGGKLTTMFNETRSNSFKVEGANMTAESLGITTRTWQTKEDIAQSIKEIKDAMYKVRDMVEVLGNNLSIIETRMNFTDALTDILQIGADELVLADMNEESANYLALQTRQQLAVNALSLAAQSSSAVLKLF